MEEMKCKEIEFVKHEKKCHEFFDDIVKGAFTYVSVERIVSENELGEVYINELSIEDTQYVRISLLTDKIIEYDFNMFSGENNYMLSNIYRPYFVSFIVELEDNNLKDIEKLGAGWYIGQFSHDERNVGNEELLLNGILEISASPINYLDGRLLVFTNKTIKKAVLDKINNTYNPRNFVYTSSLDIETTLNDTWLNDFPNTIDIYNVGHGNSDYIRGTSHRILYDIGYNYRSFPKRHNSRYLRAVNAIRHLKPSCVILSHWDTDHIIGCAYANQDIFNAKWIAPYLVSSNDMYASPNSIRLAHYLKVLGNLCLVDREQKNKLIATIQCVNGVEIKLWLGSGTSILTSKNKEGLLLEISDLNGRCPHILLAGDVPYRCMPNILNMQIDFMHVPHHCSNMELDRLKNLSGKGKCAIVSTNRKKDGSINCNNNHKNELKKKFENVVNTIDKIPQDDEANLSVQISYWNGTFCFR